VEIFRLGRTRLSALQGAVPAKSERLTIRTYARGRKPVTKDRKPLPVARKGFVKLSSD